MPSVLLGNGWIKATTPSSPPDARPRQRAQRCTACHSLIPSRADRLVGIQLLQ
ncbi:hypothetical protein LC612_42655 [Nostoc sp. CHAB 5834]|nr:hypothetical protein [Nostoc sp. CHAB 5834]